MHFRRMIPALPILLLVATLAGCGLFSNSQNTNALFAESFDDTARQMDRYSESTGSAGVTGGEFQLQVLEPNYMHWALVSQAFGDTVIEFQARKAAGPDDNLYGAICRYQDDLNFYFLVISSDGYYGIGSVIQGARSLIGSQEMRPFAIHPGWDRNQSPQGGLCRFDALARSQRGAPCLGGRFDPRSRAGGAACRRFHDYRRRRPLRQPAGYPSGAMSPVPGGIFIC